MTKLPREYHHHQRDGESYEHTLKEVAQIHTLSCFAGRDVILIQGRVDAGFFTSKECEMSFAQAFAEVLTKSALQALETSSIVVLDECATDTEKENLVIEDTFLAGYLPPRFIHRYNKRFIHEFAFCLYTVGWKLAQPQAVPMASLGEELALWVMIQYAEGVLESTVSEPDLVIDEAYSGFCDLAFEDMDFLFLYDPQFDGIDETELAHLIGVTSLAFADWFRPFSPGSDQVGLSVHPYLLARATHQNRRTRGKEGE